MQTLGIMEKKMEATILGLYRGYIGVIEGYIGVYWGHIGIMEQKMEASIL